MKINIKRCIVHDTDNRKLLSMNNFNELILNNFKKAKSEYKNYSIERSKEWHQVNNSKSNKFLSLDNLINFRSCDVMLSEGFDTFCHDSEERRETYTLFVEILMELGFEFVFNNLNKKNVGNHDNPYKLNDRFFYGEEIAHIYWFNDLVKFVFGKKKIKTVFEIGGGFGSLARIILNNYDCKFFSIDLPEQNLLTSYYLNESLPQKKIYLYSDYLKEKDEFVSSDSVKNFDIFILPPWAKFNNELKIDLFINTRSMMEMEFEVIKKYFYIIHKHISDDGFFLNINRYTKNLIDINATRGGRAINLGDYPYDNNWEVKLSKKSFSQNHIHFLLTQRKFSNFKNNIKSEMEKIKIETIKYKTNSDLGSGFGQPINVPIAHRKGFLRKFIVRVIFHIIKILFKKSFFKKVERKLKRLEYDEYKKKIKKLLKGERIPTKKSMADSLNIPIATVNYLAQEILIEEEYEKLKQVGFK